MSELSEGCSDTVVTYRHLSDSVEFGIEISVILKQFRLGVFLHLSLNKKAVRMKS